MTLACHGLAIGYPGRTIGTDIEFSLKRGDTVAILGPNGGGKTTLLKTLLGLLSARAGAVVLEGTPITALSVRNRAQALGYVPQAHAGAFALSVRDMVLMGRTAHQGIFARPSREDRSATEQSLGELGILHLADQPFTMISGGERQLALIARALAQQPRFILLDEPTASLDFGNQGKFLRQIGRLSAQNLGVLFTTHDPNHALRHAHQVILFGRGKILDHGVPSSVITRSALTAFYQAAVEQLDTGMQRAFLPL